MDGPLLDPHEHVCVDGINIRFSHLMNCVRLSDCSSVLLSSSLFAVNSQDLFILEPPTQVNET